MPATTPSDDVWVTVTAAGNNVWIDSNLRGAWRLRAGKIIVEEFLYIEDACAAAQEYIKAKHALKGI